MPSRRAATRSLADDLRLRAPDDLVELLVSRPDLARPAPADLTALAARASTPASVHRAVDTLDRAHLHALEALVVAGEHPGPRDGVDLDAAATLLGATRRRLAPLVARLHALALVWRGHERVHVVRPVVEVLGPHVAGLAPATAAVGPVPPGAVSLPDGLLDDVPGPARVLLDRLAWGPPVGDLDADGRGPAAEAASWLLARGLLESLGPGRVLLPRAVALALRGGRLHRAAELDPPAVAQTAVGVEAAAAAAASRAWRLIALVDDLAAEWGPRPPRVLRSGGLAIRDLRRLAALLDVSPGEVAFVVELAHEAGLVADDGEADAVWAPTSDYDQWERRPASRRWSLLVRAWLASTRAPHLVGQVPPPGAPRPRASTGPVNALAEGAGWAPIRAVRRGVLAELAALAPGAGTTPADLVERLSWRHPLRRRDILAEAVTAVLTETETLGVTGRGALTPAARAVLAGSEDEIAEELLDAHLPPPVGHVLVQADLTAVAPGRLEPGLARFLRLAADVESRGGATVYRFGPDSVRRCLDAGWTAEEILAALREASRTPVPQPLEYLVTDVARRHGRLRVGAVATYVRGDDETALDALACARELAGLGLRRLSATVLVADADPRAVLSRLRAAGLAPIAEDHTGTPLAGAERHHRARRQRAAARPARAGLDEAGAADVVAALHACDDAREDAGRTDTGTRMPASDPAVTLALLREAAVDRRLLWVGVSDGNGDAHRLLLLPERVEGGRIHGSVEGSGRSFSIHRLTGAVPAD